MESIIERISGRDMVAADSQAIFTDYSICPLPYDIYLIAWDQKLRLATVAHL